MPAAREDAARRVRRAALVVLSAAFVAGAAACSGGTRQVGAGSASPRPSTVTTAATPATGTSAPAPMPAPTSPPPLRSVAPVRRVAAATRVFSPNWVGYSFRVGGVTGARARWVHPVVTSRPEDEMFIVVGVGGWDTEDLIQAGTYSYAPSSAGPVRHGVWYQLVPEQDGAVFPGARVLQGDLIEAAVEQDGSKPDRWVVRITDLTNGHGFSTAVSFRSRGTDPCFVIAAPSRNGDGGPYLRLPHWDRVDFEALEVRLGKRWVPAASLPSYRIDMRRGGGVKARVGPLSTASSFTVPGS